MNEHTFLDPRCPRCAQLLGNAAMATIGRNMEKAFASVDTHAKHRDVKQARPARVGSAVLRQQQTPEPGRDPDNG
jgi:hypothetical protein